MAQIRYEDNEELYFLVQQCVDARLKFQEAKTILESKNYFLTVKQYQRIKKRINDNTKSKISEFTPFVLNQFQLSLLDEINKMKNDMLAKYDSETISEKRIKYDFVLKLNTQYQSILMSLIMGNNRT